MHTEQACCLLSVAEGPCATCPGCMMCEHHYHCHCLCTKKTLQNVPLVHRHNEPQACHSPGRGTGSTLRLTQPVQKHQNMYSAVCERYTHKPSGQAVQTHAQHSGGSLSVCKDAYIHAYNRSQGTHRGTLIICNAPQKAVGCHCHSLANPRAMASAPVSYRDMPEPLRDLCRPLLRHVSSLLLQCRSMTLPTTKR